jgi:pyrroline-5-carboxylate reductase
MTLPDHFSRGLLLLVGGGNMGCALAEGWLASGLPRTALHVIEPHPSARLLGLGLGAHQLHEAPPEGLALRLIVMAVKPQMMETVLPSLVPLLTPETLLLSIAAGTSVARLSAGLGGHERIVRVMPNTPAAIGAGVSAAWAPPGIEEPDRALVTDVMAAAGALLWIETEAQMAAVTALSGSGPAYVFHLIEAMTAAGVAQGLPEAIADRLARETVAGSGLLARASDSTAAILREQVTSPGGTTAAGLAELMGANGLVPLIGRTIAAAADRARALDR